MWCCEIVWGVPASEMRRFERRIAALERKMEEPGASDQAIVTWVKKLLELRVQQARYFGENSCHKPKLPLFKLR
jgi:hypothetical protein